MKKIFVLLILSILVVTIVWFGFVRMSSTRETASPTNAAIVLPGVQAVYSCSSGKYIQAEFFQGAVSPVRPGEPPRPSGSVKLVLSDGRNFNLPQTISASGVRFAAGDESVIFWNKGDSAFIIENGVETYAGCAEIIWTLGNEHVDRAVTDFLLSREQLSWKTQAGSTNFCVFQNLAPDMALFPHYLWVRCGEYMMVDGQLKELSGTSVPIRLDYPNELSYYDPGKFTLSIPRDGSLYDQDVKKIFPREIWNRLHFESGPLNERIERKAREYFSLGN